MEKDEQIEEKDKIKEIITEKIEGDNLIKEITYDKIPTKIEIIDINNIKAKINKIDSAIKQWESKKKPLQDLVDKYDNLKSTKTL
jgi:hypothetical protein